MELPVLDLAVLLLALVAALCAFRLLRDGPPPPWRRRRYHPISGTFLHQLLNVPRLYDFHTKLARRNRSYRLLGLTSDTIFTVDPANVEYILKTNAANYGKGNFNYEKLTDLFGDGIFVVDGEKWRHQRKLAIMELSSRASRNSTSTVSKKTAARVANIISEAATKHEAVEIQELFMKSTMDAIFEMTCGVQLDSLLGSKQGSEFVKAFDEAMILIVWRYINFLWKITRFFNIGTEAALKKRIKVIHDFLSKIIISRINDADSTSSDCKMQGDLLSQLVMQMNKNSQNLDLNYVRDVIFSLLVAGKDTTAGTLSWFLYLLCKHPDVQEKIAHEIKQAVQSDKTNGFEEFANNITDETIGKLHYLHAALSETLRLYPPAPLDGKVCFSDDVLPDGCHVRKGDVVDYQPYCMGRMTFLWGDDAEDFRPERWLDDNLVFRPRSSFEFSAFQAGTRICIGKDFAYRQMKIYAAIILNFFKFRMSDENKIPKYKITVTLQIDNGLHLYAYHR